MRLSPIAESISTAQVGLSGQLTSRLEIVIDSESDSRQERPSNGRSGFRAPQAAPAAGYAVNRFEHRCELECGRELFGQPAKIERENNHVAFAQGDRVTALITDGHKIIGAMLNHTPWDFPRSRRGSRTPAVARECTLRSLENDRHRQRCVCQTADDRIAFHQPSWR